MKRDPYNQVSTWYVVIFQLTVVFRNSACTATTDYPSRVSGILAGLHYKTSFLYHICGGSAPYLNEPTDSTGATSCC